MKREKPEFDHVTLDLSRVTRVTKGGKHLSFRALVVIGDRKGRVGFGLDKGKDVQIAMEKSQRQAKKNMIRIPFTHETIPHRVSAKFKSASVLIKPAPRGSGIIAGSAVRAILDLAGVPNASAKILSRTHNPVTLTKATFLALSSFVPRASMKTSAPVAPVVVEDAVKEDASKTRKPRAKKVEASA
jgi:small subunit ribosomal protein S5